MFFKNKIAELLSWVEVSRRIFSLSSVESAWAPMETARLYFWIKDKTAASTDYLHDVVIRCEIISELKLVRKTYVAKSLRSQIAGV